MKKICPPGPADRCSKTGRTKLLRSAMQLPVPAEMPAAFRYSDLSAIRRLHSDRLAGLCTRIPPAARSGEGCAMYSCIFSVAQRSKVVNLFSERTTPPGRSPGVLAIVCYLRMYALRMLAISARVVAAVGARCALSRPIMSCRAFAHCIASIAQDGICPASL